MTEELHKFYTVEEFCKILNVSSKQLRNMIKEGKIKAVRISDKPKSPWRIPESEALRWRALAYGIEDETN